jgi:hypothetical protein
MIPAGAWLRAIKHSSQRQTCHSPPDHDLSGVSARYSIKIADPICQPDKVIPIQ